MADQFNEYFNRSEFRCKCGCGWDVVDVFLLQILTQVRTHFDAPVRITSGCRCARYNATIPGAGTRSQHTLGKAADIQVKNTPPRMVADWIDAHYSQTLGIGRYKDWTHVDVRPMRARWGEN